MTEQDFVNLKWCYLDYRWPLRYRLIVSTALKLTALGFFFLLLEGWINLFTAWGFIIASALSVEMMFFRTLYGSMCRNKYRRRKKQFLEEAASLHSGGVEIVNASGEYCVPWAFVTTVIDGPKGVLFLLARKPWLWLPSRLFQDETSVDDILRLLEEAKVSIRTERRRIENKSA